MREKPALQDYRLIGFLEQKYGLPVAQLEFLPIGADISAAKYRVVAKDAAQYFLKLKKGPFEEASLAVPQFLHDQGLRQLIPPLVTRDGSLWTILAGYTCILYPYIEGRNAFEVELSDAEWIDFGAALKHIQSVSLPPDLQRQIQVETWSPRWRELARGYQAVVESCSYADPLATKMAAVMHEHREQICLMIERAEQLAGVLRGRSMPRVLCHADLHAWNLLHSPQEGLRIIDWDNPILAPKERDLMFIGAGVGGIWNDARQAALFYQGYGALEPDLTALAYYRLERILEDVVEYSQQILSASGGYADRERGLQRFTDQFLPDQVVEIAWQTDQKLKAAG